MNNRMGSLLSPVAALLSASCCVLPMGLLLVGFTSLGPFVFLMRYRWWTLSLSVLMLAAAFYVVYRPQAVAACAQGICTPQALRRRRFIVWLSAVFMLIFVIVGEMLSVTMTVGG